MFSGIVLMYFYPRFILCVLQRNGGILANLCIYDDERAGPPAGALLQFWGHSDSYNNAKVLQSFFIHFG